MYSEIAEHFGGDVTERKLAALYGMTVEQYRAFRDQEPVDIFQPEEQP